MVALLAYLLTVKLCHILEQCPHFETYFSANFGVECSKNNGVQFVSVIIRLPKRLQLAATSNTL